MQETPFPHLCVLGQVDVVDAGRVEVHRVESRGRPVDDLEPRALLHGQIDQKRPVLQLAERLEGHELVVGLRSPRVYLYGVAQSDHEELDALVLHDLEVNGALQLANVDPAWRREMCEVQG